ncbi:MAG: hypothetical protein HOI95_11145 [Chromatiales bacterium]|nr:hypothetical protein [Chromatiales bacterium]
MCKTPITILVALAVATFSWFSAAAEVDTAKPRDYGRVGYASLTGPIDRLRHRYLKRFIEDARAQKLDTVIVHIDTDGGEVSHAREMFKLILDQARDGPRMIAFVDFRAISAGAMVSYAHEEIYISASASIGDIGVIFIGADGEMKYAPEKVETVVRSLLTQAAQLRGWDGALLLKMTARTQKLYHVTLPDGTKRYVIEDDLAKLLAEHPKIDPENRQQVWIYRGEDRLLTLTGREALDLKMATGIAESQEDLYSTLGIESADVIDLKPGAAELTAWNLATFAPALAGLAFLFVIFEMKTPGVGLWALLALGFGVLFGLAQYYLDMAENLELLLIVVGISVVALEVFLGVGGGVLALVGAGIALLGLIMSFIPNELSFDLSDEVFRQALFDAILSSLMAVGVAVVGVLAAINVLPRSTLRQRLAVTAEVLGTAAGSLAARAPALVGETGVACEMLRPSGTVDIDGERHGARAQHGAYIDPGATIEVVAIEFGELVVRSAPITHKAGGGGSA